MLQKRLIFFEEFIPNMALFSKSNTEIVMLVVGDYKFKTITSTLMQECNSMLPTIFNKDYKRSQNFINGRHFIDRDGDGLNMF